jgi:hypothetical protein
MSKIHLLRKPQGEKLQIFVPWVSHGHKRKSKIFVRYNSTSPKLFCCHAKGYCARQQEKEYHAKVEIMILLQGQAHHYVDLLLDQLKQANGSFHLLFLSKLDTTTTSSLKEKKGWT